MDQSLIDQYRLYNQLPEEKEEVTPVPMPYDMPKQVKNYLDNYYSNNPFSNIEYYEGGGKLLNSEHMKPLYMHEDFDPSWYENTGGLAPDGDEFTYITNIENVGQQVPLPPLKPLVSNIVDPKNPNYAAAVAQKERLDKMAMEMAKANQIEEHQELQAHADWESDYIARVGIHEAIHSNMLDREKGAYPNAIAQILKGTSELGIPARRGDIDQSAWFRKRVDAGGHHAGVTKYQRINKDPYFEQNELITQALTELNTPRVDPPNAYFGPDLIWGNYDYSTWNMDKPGGPMTQQGLEKFLFEKTQPFYDQLLDDAEKGYVQDSIYATPPHLWGIRTKGT
jgi:hypothetical protein